MRRFALVLLAACGGASDRPRCVDALNALAARLGNAKSPELPVLIGTCEQEKWTQPQRRCLANAPTVDAAVDCVLGATAPLVAPQPSNAVVTLVARAKPWLRVSWFAPAESAVTAHVQAYFKALGVDVEVLDRVVEAKRAQRYRITRDGTLVLARGDGEDARFERVELALEPARARHALARLDGEIRRAGEKLARERAKIYLTTGHGEIAEADETERKITTLVNHLTTLGMQRGELTAGELATDVPADASVVAILGPVGAFAAAEQDALARYLDRGGSLLVALEPSSTAGLPALDATLGVRRVPGHLVDDKNHLVQKQALADRRIVITNKLAAHPTTTSAARATSAVVLLDAGVLESVPSSATTTITIRSMPESFIDLDDDLTYDAGREQRRSYDVAAAIEGAKFRAVVIADVDVFADALIAGGSSPRVTMLGGTMFADVIRWLVRDDGFVPDEPRVPLPEPSTADRARAKLARSLGFLKR